MRWWEADELRDWPSWVSEEARRYYQWAPLPEGYNECPYCGIARETPGLFTRIIPVNHFEWVHGRAQYSDGQWDVLCYKCRCHLSNPFSRFLGDGRLRCPRCGELKDLRQFDPDPCAIRGGVNANPHIVLRDCEDCWHRDEQEIKDAINHAEILRHFARRTPVATRRWRVRLQRKNLARHRGEERKPKQQKDREEAYVRKLIVRGSTLTPADIPREIVDVYRIRLALNRESRRMNG